MGLIIDHDQNEIFADSDLRLVDSEQDLILSDLDVVVPTGFIVGLQLIYSSGISFFIRPGFCRSDSDDFNMSNAGQIGVDVSGNGANGLDTGSMAAATMYHVFLIGDSNEVNPIAGLVSLSQTSPTMPSGYDRKRRIGSIASTDLSGVDSFLMSGSGSTRLVHYSSLSSESIHQTIVSGGTATSFTTITANDVPPTARTYLMFALPDADNVSHQTFIRPVGASVNLPILRFQPGVFLVGGTSPTEVLWTPLDANSQFQYKVASMTNGVGFRGVGYIDELLAV